jgi:hypothetical protein
MYFFTCVVKNLHSMQVMQIPALKLLMLHIIILISHLSKKNVKLHKYFNILRQNRENIGNSHFCLKIM